jgi:hypothetical protein
MVFAYGESLSPCCEARVGFVLHIGGEDACGCFDLRCNCGVESKVGTAETEMDEGKPAAVTARDSETDSEQWAEPDVMDKI